MCSLFTFSLQWRILFGDQNLVLYSNNWLNFRPVMYLIVKLLDLTLKNRFYRFGLIFRHENIEIECYAFLVSVSYILPIYSTVFQNRFVTYWHGYYNKVFSIATNDKNFVIRPNHVTRIVLRRCITGTITICWLFEECPWILWTLI